MSVKTNISEKEYTSIEHPGLMKNESTFYETLGGIPEIQKAVSTSFRNPKHALLELKLRPRDHYHHPVQAKLKQRNDILVRIKKNGEIDSAGRIRHTFVFRDMADFQYSTENSPFTKKLDASLRTLDFDAISKFNIDLSPVQRDHLDMPPPPLFSQVPLPTFYNYQQNPLVGRVRLPDGSTTIMNLKGQCRVWIITADMKVEHVPTKKHQKLSESPSKIVQEVIDAIKPLFHDRPMWTRRALLNHIDPSYLHYLKFALPYISYLWSSGPFRDTYTIFGYDPRKDPKAAAYQALFFKLRLNKNQKGHKTHTFDGKTLYPLNRIYQICDITDPQISSLLQDSPLRPDCHRETGWYRSGRFYKIRDLMREKLYALIEGRQPSDVTLDAIMNAEEVDVSDKETNEEDKVTSAKDSTLELDDYTSSDARVNELMKNLMERSQEHEGFDELYDFDEDYEDIFGE
ncbi:transcription factor tfiiic complex a box associated subunit sfc1 [Schizosaccharomyces octosporus yFS286]|uniref:Transcription factor tfiiic complex a box associated subunit sfc1 n=1 Tax=Schizosaccharomyces octosporus (strain yFS286) TaxID=483514 RepID=S9Q577_SCHOY|nr:transcription factor tfiiic complex a box associated subunit sfc1 [Schizosaccharomyces octosporus yFS286]EPX74793.1 transcription factor tfiiic complex a box associated subunit sfc1 [Schizosaccharomyces octosporus yFS286]